MASSREQVNPQTSTPAETAFYAWLRSNGASIADSVGLSSFEAEGMGRGAIALEDIPADTLLFSLPRTLLLNTSNSSLPKLLPEGAFATLMEGGGWTPLILCMMYESLRPAGTSKWAPYFDLLPSPGSFDSLMFWSETELEELKGSLVLTKIGLEEAEHEYRETLFPFVVEHEAILGPKEGYTMERFHWCGSLILSRSFHVDVKDDGADNGEEEDSDDEEEERESVDDVAMVPMADLLNAKSGCDNARLFYEPLTLNMMSTVAIPRGSQIFNTYADPPNSDLLRRYGHVDEVNKADLVEVGLETVVDMIGGDGSSLTEEEREERAEWLLEQGVEDSFSLDHSALLPPEMISAVRTFLLSRADFEKAQQKDSPPRPRLDDQVATWVRKILQARLEEYSTSISDDEELLNTAGVPRRKRMAAIVRLGEKRLLQAAIDKVNEEYPEGGAPKAASAPGKKRKGDDGAKGSNGKKSRK